MAFYLGAFKHRNAPRRNFRRGGGNDECDDQKAKHFCPNLSDGDVRDRFDHRGPGHGQAVFEASENHIKNDTEGAMETPDRIRKSIRMFLDSGSDPRVRQLEQQRTARA